MNHHEYIDLPTSPQLSEELPTISEESTRMVGGQVMHVTIIPPENPETVRERDKVGMEFTGRRPMAISKVPWNGFINNGRKAPRFRIR